jgi:diketogulonate reductase-like aldo/keto reductase
MRYETFHGLQIPKIGFGTWTIGGHGSPDPASDVSSLAALRSALELGYTHFDTAESYSRGHSEELLGRVIREMGVPRETLFITTKVSPEHLKPADVQKSCENSLRRLGMTYVDLYLIHWPRAGMHLPETFGALNRLVREGKVRHLGVSNFDLAQLQESAALSETPLMTDQVPYSTADRTYRDNGVLAYCQRNGVLFTAYSPVKDQDFSRNEKVQRIARARGLTPQQVAMAWLTTQPRVITIPMSFNPQHQAENLAAGDVVLNPDEMELLAE